MISLDSLFICNLSLEICDFSIQITDIYYSQDKCQNWEESNTVLRDNRALSWQDEYWDNLCWLYERRAQLNCSVIHCVLQNQHQNIKLGKWHEVSIHIIFVRKCLSTSLIERSWVQDYLGAKLFIRLFVDFYITNLFSPNLTWDNVILLGVWFS